MQTASVGQTGTEKPLNHGLLPKFNRANLLTKLRAGPVDSRNWPEVAKSRKSLNVRIHKMREAGFEIESDPIEGSGTPVPPVRYVLIAEPCCAYCGRGAV